MADPRAALLESFIRDELLVDHHVQVRADSRLLSEGLIDSLGAVRLAALVEETFGVRFDDSELRPGELETIDDILAAVDARR
jgi:acyl carrier protein